MVCLGCCLAGLAASPLAALGEGSAPKGPHTGEGSGAASLTEGSLVTPGSPTEVEQVRAQEEAKRSNPEAVRAREASETKYEGLHAELPPNEFTRETRRDLGGRSRVEASRDGVSLARMRQQAQAQETARRRWLESPEARTQRAASRIAFHGLSARAAGDLLSRDFGSTVAAASTNPAVSIARAGRVVRYLGDDRAVVRTARGLRAEDVECALGCVWFRWR